jgi:hypothetical protein
MSGDRGDAGGVEGANVEREEPVSVREEVDGREDVVVFGRR